MTLISRSQILAARLPHIDVPVPELGPGSVARIRQMSVSVRANYLETMRAYHQAVIAWSDDQALPADEQKGIPKPVEVDHAIQGIIASLVDEDGNNIFTDADAPLFADMSQNTVTRLWEAVEKINYYERYASDHVEVEKKD